MPYISKSEYLRLKKEASHGEGDATVAIIKQRIHELKVSEARIEGYIEGVRSAAELKDGAG